MRMEELPDGWVEAPLGECLQPGGLFDGPFGSSLKTSDYTESGVRVIRLENLANLRFVGDKHTYISKAKYETLAKHTIRPGDVLFGSFVDGATRVCLVPRLDGPAIAKADCFCVRPESRLLDAKFLVYQLGASATRDALIEQIHGATRPRVTTRQLREFAVVLPPVAEQKRIVEKVEALLAQVQAARDRLERVQQILKRFRQSVLAAACEGRLTEACGAGSVDGAAHRGDWDTPASWRWLSLAELLDQKRAAAYGVLQPGPHVPGGVPFVRIGDLSGGTVVVNGLKRISSEIAKTYPRTRLQGGEVLVSLVGTIGRVAVAPPELAGANVARAIAVLPLSGKVLPTYVRMVLDHTPKAQELEGLSREVARKTLNLGLLKRVRIPVPSLTVQEEIVSHAGRLLAAGDLIEARVNRVLSHCTSAPQAILAKAFAGELVPTEAVLARAEGRGYESGEELLARVRGERVAVEERRRSGRGRKVGRS